MRQYNIRFSGRKVGAIGKNFLYQKKVYADSDSVAIKALYDTHEHVTAPCEEMADGTLRRMSFTGL